MKTALSIIWGYISKLDKTLLLLCTVASAWGVVLLYSLPVNNGYYRAYFGASLYKTQLIASVLGILVALILSGIDYKYFAKLWFIHAPIAVILVMLTFTSLGIMREGSDNKAWLDFFGLISFQPAEVLKISFILTFAMHLNKVGGEVNRLRNFIPLCFHGAVPTLLIMGQGDDGTALVFVFIFFCMIFAAGLSWKYLLAGGIAAPFAGMLIWFKFLGTYQKNRILVLFNPDIDPTGLGIANQQIKGKIALGSGQLSGKGLFGGDYYYVAEMHNDFIFSYIGQVAGFIGCVATICVLAAITIKLLFNSRFAKDPLGKYICVGVFAIITFHTIVNIGMVLGVMPVIGLPLPFISAGGTSVVTLYAAIGVAMSVFSHKTKGYALFYDKH